MGILDETGMLDCKLVDPSIYPNVNLLLGDIGGWLGSWIT